MPAWLWELKFSSVWMNVCMNLKADTQRTFMFFPYADKAIPSVLKQTKIQDILITG